MFGGVESITGNAFLVEFLKRDTMATTSTLVPIT